MDRRSGGGEESLCGHWSTRRFSRCPTLNPRLRCSAPARPPPGTPPLLSRPLSMDVCPSSSSGGRARMPSPSGSDTTPFFVIANARASGLITLAAAGQAPGAAGWNPAASGELRDQISAQPGTARTAGTRGQGQTTGPFFTTAQHRIPSSTDKEKNMPYPDILDLFAGPAHCLASPLASHCLDRPSQRRHAVGLVSGGPLRWQGCPHCPDPSSCRTPTPGPSSRVVAVLSHWTMGHGSAGSALSLPRECVLLFRIIHLVGCSASRVFT